MLKISELIYSEIIYIIINQKKVPFISDFLLFLFNLHIYFMVFKILIYIFVTNKCVILGRTITLTYETQTQVVIKSEKKLKLLSTAMPYELRLEQ